MSTRKAQLHARGVAAPKGRASGAPSQAAHGAGPTSSKVVRLRGQRATLGAGAHFAKLRRKLAEGRFEAELFDGTRHAIGVSPEVDLGFADQCLAEQEVVLVGVVGADVVLFGALRTKAAARDEVVVEAARKVTLRAGKSKLELGADGKIKLSGNDVTVDAPREVRIASAHLEIP